MTSSARPTLRQLWTVGPIVLTLFVLGGAWADKAAFHQAPADAAPYHVRVKKAAAAFPYNVGPWLGTETPLPTSAVELLRSPVDVSRRYQNVRTGRTASLLIVHCQDARDLIGHYPPVCYAAHGWTKAGAVAAERQAGGFTVPVTDYTFTSSRLERATDLRIDNFMVLPDGQFCRDMGGVEEVAQDYRRKFFGAAQVQLITDSTWRDSDRRELFRELITAAGPLLDEIRKGMAP